jgi:hypothetical protein
MSRPNFTCPTIVYIIHIVHSLMIEPSFSMYWVPREINVFLVILFYSGYLLITVFFGIWNLESGSFRSLRKEFCMQIHKEFRGISGDFTAKNTAELRGIPYVFEKIPYSVGSQKRTSVDTLVEPLTLQATKTMSCTWQFRSISAYVQAKWCKCVIYTWKGGGGLARFAAEINAHYISYYY